MAYICVLKLRINFFVIELRNRSILWIILWGTDVHCTDKDKNLWKTDFADIPPVSTKS